MDDKKTIEVEQSLKAPTAPTDATASYVITIRIRNKSSMGITKADVAVKDEGSNSVAEVFFGRIEPGREDVRTANLPGGVDFAAYNIWPDVGEKRFGFGYGNNVSEVNINLTD